MSAVNDVRESFVQLWGALGPFWGVSPTTARTYGWLLSRPEGADAEEIMAGLEMSRGAVSMACRELREWGLVMPEKAPGSRRVLYRPETDLAKVTRNVLLIRKRREWDPIREHLSEWIPLLEEEAKTDVEAKAFLERLQAIETLTEMADSMAEIFLKGGSVGGFGLKVLRGGLEVSRAVRRQSPTKASLKAALKPAPETTPAPDAKALDADDYETDDFEADDFEAADTFDLEPEVAATR